MKAPLSTDPKVGRGWAWAIDDGRGGWMLCNWAEPYSRQLRDADKPTPDAKRVRVTLVPSSQWLRKNK